MYIIASKLNTLSLKSFETSKNHIMDKYIPKHIVYAFSDTLKGEYIQFFLGKVNIVYVNNFPAYLTTDRNDCVHQYLRYLESLGCKRSSFNPDVICLAQDDWPVYITSFEYEYPCVYDENFNCVVQSPYTYKNLGKPANLLNEANFTYSKKTSKISCICVLGNGTERVRKKRVEVALKNFGSSQRKPDNGLCPQPTVGKLLVFSGKSSSCVNLKYPYKQKSEAYMMMEYMQCICDKPFEYILEEESRSTVENIVNTLKIICSSDMNVSELTIVSSKNHIPRCLKITEHILSVSNLSIDIKFDFDPEDKHVNIQKELKQISMFEKNKSQLNQILVCIFQN